MDRNKVVRLNLLFEKMTSNLATIEEQSELKALYKEYIDEGRDSIRLIPNCHKPEKRYANH